MRTPIRARRFERAKKRGKDMEKLKTVLSLLIDGKPLPESFRDHPLKGEWVGFRDLHIEPDWLLLYAVEGNELRLARTGTHADVFDD